MTRPSQQDSVTLRTTLKNDCGAAISAIWMGLILGVCFYAAPIKFTAEDVPTSELLKVGKVTFQGFTYVEFIMFALLCILAFSRRTKVATAFLVTLFVMLVIQKFLILPVLDEALDKTVAGTPTREHGLHWLYAIMDGIKVIMLMVLYLLLKQIVGSSKPNPNVVTADNSL